MNNATVRAAIHPIQFDFDQIEPIVNRAEITAFVKNASPDQLDGFLRRQMYTVQQAARLSASAQLCCVYDLITTARNAAAENGIPAAALHDFLQTSDAHIPQNAEAFLRRLFARILEVRDSLTKSKNQLVHRVKLFIEENHSNPDLSLVAVAAIVGITPSYLSTQFNRESVETFSEYLTRVRIRHTAELLKSSSDSLTEIAQKVGYSDQYYLSRTFKKTLGISPREFRNM